MSMKVFISHLICFYSAQRYKSYITYIIAMKSKILIFLITFMTTCISIFAQQEGAQQQTQPAVAMLKIGYFSYDEALRAMPDYSIVTAKLHDLRSQYDAEMQDAEKEFNEKYESFLENQKIMADAIREKRQSELQSMMERNVAFRHEAERLMAQAEQESMAPLHEKLNKVIANIAEERAYIMVVNTDSNACPYLNPIMAENISILVIERLKSGM